VKEGWLIILLRREMLQKKVDVSAMGEHIQYTQLTREGKQIRDGWHEKKNMLGHQHIYSLRAKRTRDYFKGKQVNRFFGKVLWS